MPDYVPPVPVRVAEYVPHVSAGACDLVAWWVGGDASPVPASVVLIHIRPGKTKVVVCLSYSLSKLLIYKK